jgi:hypothetical protein
MEDFVPVAAADALRCEERERELRVCRSTGF